MGIWHKSALAAYLAVLLGVTGHASSEFVAVLSGTTSREAFEGYQVWAVIDELTELSEWVHET